jgi:hypothetical protein
VIELRGVVGLAHDLLHQAGVDHPIAGAATLTRRFRRHREPASPGGAPDKTK